MSHEAKPQVSIDINSTGVYLMGQGLAGSLHACLPSSTQTCSSYQQATTTFSITKH